MKSIVKKSFLYITGLLIISIGVNFSKLSGLGITPVSSIPRACEQIWGWTLGNTTMVIYLVLVALQLLILRKRFKLTNALGIVVTVIFSMMIDLTGTDPNAYGHLMIMVPKPSNYVMSLLYMIVGMVVVAVGVFLYLIPKWAPMPAEGLADAISVVTGKSFGDCKTYIDTAMVVIALILQLTYFGGVSSFVGEDVIVREGTIVCAIAVGQLVKRVSQNWSTKMNKWII